MTSKYIAYEKISGYKFRLREEFTWYCPWLKGQNIKTAWFQILPNGVCVASVGYAWDGVSGLGWNTKKTMIPSLKHDIGYQCIRMGHLSSFKYKPLIDQQFEDDLVAGRFWPWMAEKWRWGVDKFGKFFGLRRNKNEGKIYYAPEKPKEPA